jgi:ubiquitin carboxyl-terminal hydrolase L3
LHKLVEESPSLPASEQTLLLEDSEFLEGAYRSVAIQGDSAVPEDAEAEVDYHYICFVCSDENHHVYQLDGDRIGPIDRGVLFPEGEDLLGEGMRLYLRSFTKRYEEENMSFNLMALVASGED